MCPPGVPTGCARPTLGWLERVAYGLAQKFRTRVVSHFGGRGSRLAVRVGLAAVPPDLGTGATSLVILPEPTRDRLLRWSESSVRRLGAPTPLTQGRTWGATLGAWQGTEPVC